MSRPENYQEPHNKSPSPEAPALPGERFTDFEQVFPGSAARKLGKRGLSDDGQSHVFSLRPTTQEEYQQGFRTKYVADVTAAPLGDIGAPIQTDRVNVWPHKHASGS